MLDTFSDTENGETEIHVAIITFGAQVVLHQPLASASIFIGKIFLLAA
jgi:uncharacterized protein YegL